MNIHQGSVAFTLGAVLAACSSGSNNDRTGGQQPGPAAVASISVSASKSLLAIGDTAQLTATARTATGQTVTGVSFSWSTDDQTVATVTSAGIVTATGIGSTPVRAGVGSVEGSVTIRVDATPGPAVTSVEISPTQTSVVEGQSTQFFAIARDADGNVITGRGEQWTGDDSSIAFVEPLGRVTGLRAGSTTVTVVIDGKSATGTIRVDANYAFSLVYSLSESLGAPQIHSLDISDGVATSTPLFGGRSATDPTPSPDGAALAFVVTSSSSSQIFRANRDGTNAIQLTSGVGLRDQPAWSSDGSRIAYRERISGAGTDIWTMSATDGSDARNLTADLGATSQSSPTWSGTMIGGAYRIAYSHSAGGQGHIWSMRDDGSDKWQLTSSTTAYDDQPSWSPDGSVIVFQRSSSSIFGDIYRVDAIAGGAGVALMSTIGPLAGPQFAPAWSPDGQLIAFASRHASDEYQIFTVWADGTRLAQRTFSGEHADPAWIND